MKALARQYATSPKTIRCVLDDAGAREVPDDIEMVLDGRDQAAVDDPVVTVDVPGFVAERVVGVDVDVDGTLARALATGQKICRGQGYSVRIAAPLSLHEAMVEMSAAALARTAAGRKAHRVHTGRVTAVRTAP